MKRMLIKIKFKTAKYFLLASEFLVKHVQPNETCIPIFIVGTPRSGTTLIYQTVTTAFKTVYFCNYAEMRNYAPLSATLLGYFQIIRYKSGFNSNFGQSKGRFAPSQGDWLWRSLLATDTAVDSTAWDLERGRTVINQLHKLFRVPFVNKSIYMAVNIPILNKMFPNALYIRVQRKLLDNSVSQLKNLRKNGTEQNAAGDIWVSAKPGNYEELLPLPDEQKVVRQLLGLQHDMDVSFSEINSMNVLTLDYEVFCNNPGDFIAAVEKRYLELGGKLVRKSPVPGHFHSHSYADDDSPDVNALRRVVDRLVC
ncbi:MAG TPA: sulfotransferase [Gammaproteobacteria bacterium]|nr:sulfotransferase [Gammaproteobacteria bacterium]